MRTTAQGANGVAGAGGGFGTDLHTMDTAAQYVEHVGQVMTGEVNKLWSSLNIPGPSTWNSPSASAAFSNAQLQWTDAHRKLMHAIQEIADGLRSSRQQYDQAETDNQYGIAGAVRGLTY
jgi:WXG100 family type VII secretion target